VSAGPRDTHQRVSKYLNWVKTSVSCKEGKTYSRIERERAPMNYLPTIASNVRRNWMPQYTRHAAAMYISELIQVGTSYRANYSYCVPEFRS
jgi:hypothetical protein